MTPWHDPGCRPVVAPTNPPSALCSTQMPNDNFLVEFGQCLLTASFFFFLIHLLLPVFDALFLKAGLVVFVAVVGVAVAAL